MVEIKDYKHNIIISIEPSEGSVYHREIMSNDYIRLRFNLVRPIVLSRGTYVRNEWGWFILCEDYKPKYDKATNGFSYDVQFDAWYYFWNGRILTFQPKYGAVETSFSLTDYIEGQWKVILDNLRYYNLNVYSGNPSKTYREFMATSGATDKAYNEFLAREGCVEVSCVVHNAVEGKSEGLVEHIAKGISYESVKITDAIGLLSAEDAWNCEWWFEGHQLHFGHLGLNSEKAKLEWNLGVEMEDIQRTESKEDFATRLIAYGSTKNVPARYRKDLIFTVDDPSSPYLDTTRKMQASWFDKASRKVETTHTKGNGEDVGFEAQRASVFFNVTDTPNYSISDVRVELKLPHIVYNEDDRLFYSFVDQTTKSTEKLLANSTLSLIQVNTIGEEKTEFVKKTSTARVISYIPYENYTVYTLTMDDTSDSVSSSTTDLYIVLRLPVNIEGFRLPDNVQSQLLPFINNFSKVTSRYLHDCARMLRYSADFTNDSFYVVNTTAHILSGSKKGQSIAVQINKDVRNVNSDVSGTISGLSLSVGDTYSLDHVLTGKVKLSYFTDERASAISSYERRLMLPFDEYPNNYIDSSNLKDSNGNVIESRIVEVVKVYDDIYPKQELEVGEVQSWPEYEQNPEDPENPREVIKYRFLVPEDDFPFDELYFTADKFECQFQTGDLAGMTFEINFLGKGYGDGSLAYEVVSSDTYGIDLPNSQLKPQKGDKIVFYGYDPSLLSTGSNSMVAQAEKKLVEEAKKTLRKIEQDTGRYTCPLMSRYAKGLLASGGLPVMGDPVRIYNYGYFDTFRDSRVIGMEIKLDIPYDTPKFIIGEDEAYSRSAETAKSVAALTAKFLQSNGAGGGGYSATDIRAMIEQYTRDEYLSKKNDDTARGNIHFSQSAGSEQYVHGLLGTGWKVNDRGEGEFDSLSVRKFLEVPELRFNRISVMTGVQWQTFGGGLIEEVLHPDGFPENRGIVKLKLEDGEYGAVSMDDLCMGIYHNEVNKETNFVDSQDDRNGNFAFAGFTTVYFKVIGVCDREGDQSNPDSKNQYFVYEMRGDWNMNGYGTSAMIHPQPSMSFAAYANPNDSSRQACVYSTTEYTIMLTGMTDWTYDSHNIAYIEGYLNEFSIEVYATDDNGNPVFKTDENGDVIYGEDGEPIRETEYISLDGYGIGVGNIYKWGRETSVDRPRQLVNQQIHYLKTNVEPSTILQKYTWVDSDGNYRNEWERPEYEWTIESQSPDKDERYVYGYWTKTFFAGASTEVEVSDAFLFATYGTEGENALSVRIGNPIVTVRMRTSGWIEDDEPADVSQVEPVQDVSTSVELVSGESETRKIYRIELDSTNYFHYVSASENGDMTWTLNFKISGFREMSSVTMGIRVFFSEEEYVNAGIVIAPSFDGEDGVNGENGDQGEDAVMYELEPSAMNFICDPDVRRFMTETIVVKAYRIEGIGNRVGLSRFNWKAEYLNANNGVLATDEGNGVNDFRISLRGREGTLFDSLQAIRFTIYDTDTKNELRSTSISRVNAGEQGAKGEKGDKGNDGDKGEKGEQGDKGENAISFYIDPISEYIHTNQAGSATAEWRATMYKSTGAERVAYNDTYWKAIVNYRDGAQIGKDVEQNPVIVLSKDELNMVASMSIEAYDGGYDNKILTRNYYPIADGANGLDGVVVRQMGEWQSTVGYVNQSNLNIEGIRYLDIVQYREYDNTLRYYACNPTEEGKTNRGNTPFKGSNFWTEAEMSNFIATNLLLAKDATIDFLTGNAIYLHDDKNDISIGLQGGADEKTPMIFAGAKENEAANAPFRIYSDGTLEATRANVSGNVSATSLSSMGASANVTIENGLLAIYAKSSGTSSYKAADFGFNEKGELVLRFFDKDGTLRYNLGPSGGSSNIVAVDGWESIEYLNPNESTTVDTTTADYMMMSKYESILKKTPSGEMTYQYRIIVYQYKKLNGTSANDGLVFKSQDVGSQLFRGWVLGKARQLSVSEKSAPQRLPILPGQPTVNTSATVYERDVIRYEAGKITTNYSLRYN